MIVVRLLEVVLISAAVARHLQTRTEAAERPEEYLREGAQRAGESQVCG